MASFAGEAFDKEGDEFDNPLKQPPAETGEQQVDTDEGMSAAEMIAANESGMTEDELADLTYAFQAADMDGGGAIDDEEFSMMLSVMGCDIEPAQVQKVIADAKEGFKAWLKMADEENIRKCKVVWDKYDEDKSGTMDLEEINNVIKALQDMGFNPSPMSEADLADGELDFDEFSAWFLKQEGLPDTFAAPKANAVPGGGVEKKDGAVKKIAGAGMAVTGLALKPLAMLTKTAVTGPTELLKMSAKMGKKKGDDDDPSGDDEQAGRDQLEEDDLSFAEYVFMMRSGLLTQFLPGDWRERAEDMRKLREAFDTADVDGDNQLELEELEMVITAMNPKVEVKAEDIRKVWDVLNPEGKEWIPFSEYVAGMIQVKRDRDLSKLVPMDVPNRFQLLSLLIDTPINEDQEALIFNKMGALEKGGIKLLRKMEQPPLTKKEIRNVLDQACGGKLHMLTDVQRTKVNSTHFACVFQAFMIATITCGLAGLWENYMTMVWSTDGAVDSYFTCPEFFVDMEDPASEYYNLSLPANPGPWNSDVTWDTNVNGNFENFEPVKAEGWEPANNMEYQCMPGMCAAYPLNVTDYLLLGGNARRGGNWTPAMDGWEGECVPLQKTALRDHEALISFMVTNFSVMGLFVVLELVGLMLTALRSAVKVSIALDLRLTPLNEDRAFVANMLVRSVFELGDSEGDVMGVDAGGGGDDGPARPAIVNVMAVAWIKGRVVITGTLFKQIAIRVSNYDTAHWAKPYAGPMLAAMIWDSMLCHAIMKGAEVQAIGVTTSVEVFNEIMDTFCPLYESNPASLSETAKIQILRAIGVAIVKHGSMFPTMEILLRHAVNYLNMKKSKAVTQGGIIDDEVAMLEDFAKITTDESRAVLCTHMLCYVLDGSIGMTETQMWHKMLEAVEKVYQEERAKFNDLDCQGLRDFIIERAPGLTQAVSRVPVRQPAMYDLEMKELLQLTEFVPRPPTVTHYDPLVAQFVCQQFRANKPITCKLLTAIYDPEANKNFMARAMQPTHLFAFVFNEFTFKVMTFATADPFAICWPVD